MAMSAMHMYHPCRSVHDLAGGNVEQDDVEALALEWSEIASNADQTFGLHTIDRNTVLLQAWTSEQALKVRSKACHWIITATVTLFHIIILLPALVKHAGLY